MKTHIMFVLDKSGSMATRRSATISGFNEYLGDVQANDDLKDARFSLVTFDTAFEDVIVDQKVKDVPELAESSYIPSGMTALYDAVGHCLRLTDGAVKKKHRALVIILTDGEENSSREHTRSQIFDLIKTYEAKGNYTFVFLGCDQDVWTEGAKVGVVQGNIAAFDGQNIKAAYRRLSTATSNYAGSQSVRSVSFWDTDQDRE